MVHPVLQMLAARAPRIQVQAACVCVCWLLRWEILLKTKNELLKKWGRRIHGSVEDTKLSTNKQHSLSMLKVFNIKIENEEVVEVGEIVIIWE